MKKAKSIGCLLLLAVVTWLTGYQICDASEDAAEQIAACVQIALAGTSFSAPTAPDEDADALIPIVVGQSLTLQSVLLEAPQRISWIPRGLHQTPASALITLDHHDLSPPGRWEFLSSDLLGHSNQRWIPSIRSLAPPAA